KLKKGYKRNPCSLFRGLRKLGCFKDNEKYILKHCDTPKKPYIPTHLNSLVKSGN
ncbi:hypothetical protein HMPREF9129_1991, partial [Peptoniphilus indolicus ATCC 29427]